MDERVSINMKTSTLKELDEWLKIDADKKRWTILIIDDDTAIIKKIDKNRVI
jgi:hypothetical protein